MLANAELDDDFFRLNQQYKRLVRELLELVGINPVSLEVASGVGGTAPELAEDRFYLVNAGTITVGYRDRTAYLLDQGDLLLPDVAGVAARDSAVHYFSDGGAVVEAYPALDFMKKVFGNPAAVKLWTRLLVTQAGLQLRLAATPVSQDPHTSPGFEVYQPGDVIIRQGDTADYVFNLTEGEAEVVVDGISVGVIEEDEIFGAMAVLTDSTRTATVIAKSRCSVVKVPREQFTELIKSNPETIYNLLVDMANSIASLNDQLVGLRGSYVN
jgi:hypothetical protein